MKKLLLAFTLICCAFAGSAQTYTTGQANWTNTWTQNGGSFNHSGGDIALFSSGGNTNDGATFARLITTDGTSTGTPTTLNPGQKLTFTMGGQDGGGRSLIPTGGRIGFSLRSNPSLFYDGGSSGVFNRYNASALTRVEFVGGASTANYASIAGTPAMSNVNFATFKGGLIYEVEVISNREFNLIANGTRYNLQSFVGGAGAISQIAITNIGANMDAIFSNLAVSNIPINLTANTSENLNILGIISNNGATANSVQKNGAGNVFINANCTYTGATTIGAGTLTLNGPSANTIPSGNNVTVMPGGKLVILQDQTLGNLTLPAGATLQIATGKTLTLTGVFIGGGTILSLGTIKLAGAVAQNFPGATTAISQNNLIINNPNGVNMDNHLSVNGTLTFQSNTGQKCLLNVGNWQIIAKNVSGASATNGWVNGPLARYISNGTNNVSFDVGDATDYLPVLLTFRNVSATSPSFAVQTTAGAHPTITASGLDPAKSVARYWTLVNNGVADASGHADYDVTFNYKVSEVNGTPANYSIRPLNRNTGAWQWINMGTRAATSTQGLQAAPVDANGDATQPAAADYVIGEVACTAPAINTQPQPATYCLNPLTVTPLQVAATGTGTLTYQWYSNTANSTTNSTLIPGATSSSYVPQTGTAGTSYYYCVVTDGGCSTTSDLAQVVVNTPSYTYYPDADADGYGDAYGTALQSCSSTPPANYVTDHTDCNDNNIAVHASVAFYADNDHDGFGAGTPLSVCGGNINNPPTGYVANNTDCDDNNPLVRPASFYTDNDHDGYGTGSATMMCANVQTPPTGYAVNNADCNDNDGAVHALPFINIQPQPQTVCDGSLVTGSVGGIGISTVQWQANAGSGYFYLTGITSNPVQFTATAAYNNWLFRAAVSNSCGTVYSNPALLTVISPATYYQDADHDGYGNPNVTTVVCSNTAPPGYVTDNTDCDDNDIAKHSTFSFYADNDLDGYGAGSLVPACAVDANTPPAGYSLDNTDCNDNNNTVHTCGDVTPPVLDVPADIVQNVLGCTATIAVPTPAYSDNVGVTSLTWKMTGATVAKSFPGIRTVGTFTFNMGVTTITYTAKDAAGNTTTKSFIVTVTENVKPTITCSGALNGNANSSCRSVIIVPAAVVNDNCKVASLTWVMTGATTGNSAATGINQVGRKSFNVGVTTITYTVTDAAGNSDNCTTIVTVIDNMAPSITMLPAVPVQLITNAGCTMDVAVADPVITDNCTLKRVSWDMTGATVANSPSTGFNYVGTKTFNAGVTIITYTAEDMAGNISTGAFKVVVKEAAPPTVTCPPTQNISCATMSGNYTVDPVLATHNCPTTGAFTYSYRISGATARNGNTADASGAFNSGRSKIVWTVKDGMGNSVSCATVVVVPVNLCSGTVKFAPVAAAGNSMEDKLTVKLFPNPTRHAFALQALSGEKGALEISVYNSKGQKAGSLKGTAQEVICFGENYQVGTYMIEVRQGEKRVTVVGVKTK